MASVNILKEYCKSCGFCVKSCPKGVLAIGEQANALGYHCAEVVNPEACIGCKLCAVSCPDSAIEIYSAKRK